MIDFPPTWRRFAVPVVHAWSGVALATLALGAAHTAHAAQAATGAGAGASTTLANDTQPLPLSGAAYRVAQQAYGDFAHGDYSGAITEAREAIRQRPDVVSLRLLLANALAAQRRLVDASHSLNEAIAQLGHDPALVARKRQIDALRASTLAVARNRNKATAPNDPDALTGPALVAGQAAYQAYAKQDYANTVKYANDVIALRPDLLRLRLLLIDAASAGGQDSVAWNADLDAVKRFGDTDELRLRRTFIGNRLAPKSSAAAFAARKQGDLAQAAALGRQTVAYAPDQVDYRLQLMEVLFAANDLPAVEQVASDAIASDDTEIMPIVLRGYVRAAQGKVEQADADFTKALHANDATARNQRTARVIIADVWLSQGQAQRVVDLLAPLKASGDDTDPPIAQRLYEARRRLKEAGKGATAATATATTAATPAVSASEATAQPAAATLPATPLDPAKRPILDCSGSVFGANCDVYAADPGFAAARAVTEATTSGDKKAAVGFAREAVKAAPNDAEHRVELINALTNAGDDKEATAQARQAVDDGLLAAMPDLTAAYIAQRAGDNRDAAARFKQADKDGKLPPSATADAAYASLQAHRNKDAAAYFERGIDAGLAPADGDAAATPAQLYEMRSAHADVTRNWGFDTSLNYRGAGIQPGFASSPTPGVSNNWQAGSEVYWRPFGSLGDRLFEVYARAYDSFGVKGGQPSGVDTLQASLGARVKPFADIDAIFAFERVIPIGNQVDPDWLARVAYSGGFGTERRVDVPSWWTAQIYGEGGYYLNRESSYGTGSIEMGRTYRLDRFSPRWTVFPYAVIGADYDSTVDHSIPLGAGVGVSTRYWFRDSKYDAPRSYVDLSVQYRWHLAGDDRSRGVFFGVIYSY
ncbi:NfrA family protein [Paraburkholderia sp. DHOC27]|uniref:NfrA family protein n=1 Tax=Paraburkholderia sp. DHOC27 TaxID=2303330 RepID=UPI000E3BBAF5|nr:tetratricopeptide repeat protein [Paraburkholderia sp. DHOC27]RFU48099.1 bacteriophage N4 adsorption protein A [Paraburkholderia sp. DHOC27]